MYKENKNKCVDVEKKQKKCVQPILDALWAFGPRVLVGIFSI